MIAYIIVPLFRDIAIVLEWADLAALLETGVVRVGLALAMIWGFVGVNVMGAKTRPWDCDKVPILVPIYDQLS